MSHSECALVVAVGGHGFETFGICTDKGYHGKPTDSSAGKMTVAAVLFDVRDADSVEWRHDDCAVPPVQEDLLKRTCTFQSCTYNQP